MAAPKFWEYMESFRKELSEKLDRVHGEVESVRTDLWNHAKDEEGRWGTLNASTRSAHHRIDKVEDEQKVRTSNGWALWIALISSAAAFIFSLILFYIQNHHTLAGGVK